MQIRIWIFIIIYKSKRLIIDVSLPMSNGLSKAVMEFEAGFEGDRLPTHWSKDHAWWVRWVCFFTLETLLVNNLQHCNILSTVRNKVPLSPLVRTVFIFKASDENNTKCLWSEILRGWCWRNHPHIRKDCYCLGVNSKSCWVSFPATTSNPDADTVSWSAFVVYTE